MNKRKETGNVLTFFENRRKELKDWRTTVKDKVIHRECSNMLYLDTRRFPICQKTGKYIKDSDECCQNKD